MSQDQSAYAVSHPMLGLVLRRLRILRVQAKFRTTIEGRVWREGMKCVHYQRCQKEARTSGCWAARVDPVVVERRPTMRERLRFLLTGRP